MLLRDPQPYPEFKRRFNEFETELEHPAMPKESSFGGTYGWQNSLPRVPKPDYPSHWDRPQRKPLDIEKLTGRTAIVVMALVTLGFGSIFIVKLLQFSLAFTLR